MKHFLLIYDLSADYMARRAGFRDEHLRLAWAARDGGELVLAGALTDPVDTAVLLFEGDTAMVAQRFAENDPYVKNGLVVGWRVREWATVAGRDPATPVRPASVGPASEREG